MLDDIESILITRERIQERVEELGAEISRDFSGKNPLLVGVLKGSFVFLSDLIRQISIPCEIDFMAVSSYGNKSQTTGAVQIHMDLGQDIENRHVIVVEDILDSGLTLNYLVNYLGGRNPASITLVTLLDKPTRRQTSVTAHYVGFEVSDAFVVGFGLDYAQKYRNLPFIGVLKPDIYSD